MHYASAVFKIFVFFLGILFLLALFGKVPSISASDLLEFSGEKISCVVDNSTLICRGSSRLEMQTLDAFGHNEMTVIFPDSGFILDLNQE